jgi:hypothetical protein
MFETGGPGLAPKMKVSVGWVEITNDGPTVSAQPADPPTHPAVTSTDIVPVRVVPSLNIPVAVNTTNVSALALPIEAMVDKAMQAVRKSNLNAAGECMTALRSAPRALLTGAFAIFERRATARPPANTESGFSSPGPPPRRPTKRGVSSAAILRPAKDRLEIYYFLN